MVSESARRGTTAATCGQAHAQLQSPRALAKLLANGFGWAAGAVDLQNLGAPCDLVARVRDVPIHDKTRCDRIHEARVGPQPYAQALARGIQ